MKIPTTNPQPNQPSVRAKGQANASSLPLSERAILVHQGRRGEDPKEFIAETRLLIESAGAQVCTVLSGQRDRPVAASYIGSGKVKELADAVREHQASLVVVNHSISPVQERNLERAVSCRVLDRTSLILDIFAQRASTHEGKLQVELAQLRHLSTRLVRGWTHLERQKGGIGLRGPGESQLETDRRLIGMRIRTLRQRLERVRSQRALRRRARRKVPIPTVSLVGYTNAGKSSLFNSMTGSSEYAADQLFATLDPKMRRLQVQNFGPVVLSDTVGFIRDLPHGLVKAFHSTLEEVAAATLLIHVIDSATPERHECMAQVQEVLSEIGAIGVPQILVFNKIDLTGRFPGWEHDASASVSKVWLSAETGEGLDLLHQALAEQLRQDRIRRCVKLPPSAGRLRAMLYERLNVLNEDVTDSGDWLIEIELDGPQLGWLEQQPEFEKCRFVSGPDTSQNQLAQVGQA